MPKKSAAKPAPKSVVKAAPARRAAPKSKPGDPFKVRKTKTEAPAANDTVTPPAEVAQAIDAFRECQEQFKHFEAEANLHKDKILGYSESEYAKRAMNGLGKSFKVLGDETMVTYVVMDASSGLTDDDVAEFSRRWGEKAAEELIVRDFASIRFDGAVLEANYDAVVEALKSLPPEILDNLFKPMLMKAVPGAVEAAKRYVKSPDELLEIFKQLRIKNYIR